MMGLVERGSVQSYFYLFEGRAFIAMSCWASPSDKTSR